MKQITFLGPLGATFSHDAYALISELYGVQPILIQKDSVLNYTPAMRNGEVLKLIIDHGGYGALAMETLAEGRVAEPLESFIELLGKYSSNESCPIHIISALRMKIHFCLMTRNDMQKEGIKKILCHEKALGPCKTHIERLGIAILTVPSNGEAARKVAEDPLYADCAALGPRSAADTYNLSIIDNSFEDSLALTTFFLIGPRDHKKNDGYHNRALIVFTTKHESGALVKALSPFASVGLNMMQIHSVHAGNGTYRFAIELEIPCKKLPQFEAAMSTFKMCVASYLSFGPFEVICR